MNIRNRLAFGGKPIPNKADAFVWLDGTISGNNFVDKISGRLFPIANKDFPTGWGKGFPYKSAATFSAPVGDAALIAADVNGFFYTAGVPNQIPVISCFQDVDYAHRLFFRHIGQSIDLDTLAETYEPRVAEMVLYATVATGADLVARNSYFKVPVEITANVKWVDPVNGLNTNTGTKASPWQTLSKANTSATVSDLIYVKSGVITEATYFYSNKAVNYKIIGNTTLKSVSSAYVLFSELPNGNYIEGLTVDGESKTTTPVINYYSSIYRKCRFINPKAGEKLIGVQLGNPTFDRSILIGNFMQGGVTSAKSLLFDTCYVNCFVKNTALATIAGNNCRWISNGSAGTYQIGSTVANSIAINGGSIKANGGQSFLYTSFAQSTTETLSISNVLIDITSVSVGLLYIQTGAYKSIALNNLYVNNSTTKDLIVNQGGSSFEVKNIILSSLTSNGINYFKGGSNLTTAIVDGASIDCSSLTTGYTIGIGGEATSSSDNTLTSITIKNTKSKGPNYANGAALAPHGIFVGFQAGNVKINHNRHLGVGSSYVFKGDNTDYTSSDCGYNLSINDFIGLVLSGSKNVFTHNKTIINPKQKAFILYANVGSNGSTGTTVKNYIVVSPSAILWDIDTYSLSGLSTDYNIYYCPLAKPFKVAGVDKTFLEWQALGYDTHSIMLSSLSEAKTLFVDYDNMNYALSHNSAAIGFGQNLGEPYNIGLDASTNWGSETQLPSVVTKQQPTLWDCGAYIH